MTDDLRKTREELLDEIGALRRRVEELESRGGGAPPDSTDPSRGAPPAELARALDVFPAFVCVQDPDLTIRFANRLCREIFGHAEGKRCHELLANRSEPCDDCPTRGDMAEGTTKIWEWVNPNSGRTYRIHDIVISGPAGEPLVLKAGIDITDLKRTEAELLASKEHLLNAQRLAHVGSWEWNIPTGDVTWSDEIFRIFGLDPATFKPRIDSIMAITHPEDQGRDKELIAKAVERHEPGSYEMRIFRPDGSLRTFTSTFEGQYDEAGNLLRIVGTAHDITERRQAELERERVIAELEAKNAELERFTYTVSHDLKSPLITLMGFVDVLRHDLAAGDHESVNDSLRRIANAGRMMDRLLKDLLELSRIGRIAQPPEPVGVDELAHEAASLVAAAVAQSGAVLEIAPNLPAVLVDRTRLVEVFQNLFENAIKYAVPDRPCRIEVDARREGDWVACRVRDNGRGIDPAYHERVFKLFEKLDSHTPGTGVGLTIVHRVLEVHGGRIWIESDLAGVGTTFHFTLPTAKP